MRCNQFTIKIDKDVHWANFLEICNAAQVLNGVAFKLFIYLSAYEPGTSIEFSPSDFCGFSNASLSAEKNAFKELILEGFLVKETDNIYFFKSVKN